MRVSHGAIASATGSFWVSMRGVSFHIDASGIANLARAWKWAPEIVVDEMTAAVTEGSLLAEREIRDRTPVGATATLKGSIAAREPRVSATDVIGEVSTSIGHAAPVELGTQPHFPPVALLADWAVARLGMSHEEARGVGFAIARKIAARGTKGAFMFRDGLGAVRPQVERMFRDAGRRALARLAEAGEPA